MKNRYLIIAFLLAGISTMQAQEAATERLTAASDATKINRAAAAEGLTNELSRLSNAKERRAFLVNAMAQLEQSKAPLFEAVSKAAPDKLAALKSLLAETMLSMHLAHLSDQAEGGNDLSAGKGLLLVQTRAEGELQIQALLGEAGYAQYLAYQQAEPYRPIVQRLVKAMREKGSAITADQEQALLDGYMAALVTATEDSVKEADPKVYAGLSATERRALGVVELCTVAPLIGGPQRQRFESYLAAAVSEILNPDDFKRFQQVRAEPEARPDWRDYVPKQFWKTP